MGKDRRKATQEKCDALLEIKRRIAEHLFYLDPNSSFSKESLKRAAELDETVSGFRRDESDMETDNSDPRLAGWEPSDLGICGPKGSKFTIKKIEKDENFSTQPTCTVHYNIHHPSGEDEPSIAFFTRRETPYVYDVAALRSYVEKAIGEDIFDYCDRLDRPYDEAIERHGSLSNMDAAQRSAIGAEMKAAKENALKPIEPHLKEIVRPLHYHLDCMRVIEEIIEPLGEEGKVLLRAIENRINDMFGFALDLRQKELESLHLSDAIRGKAVASGGDRGGRALAERSSAHAAAWKLNFAKWFQPLISQHSSGRGMSRDRAIDLAYENWPKDGFEGLPGQPRQRAFPSRQTMLNTLKSLENSGTITRKRPPKGRPHR